MKNFAFGFVIALVVPAVLLYFLLVQGYADLRADDIPSRIEMHTAMGAVDASAKRHAPEGGNPVAANEANLMAGLNLYRDNCSLCHGDPSEQQGKLSAPFYPPVPKFVDDSPTDMSERQVFYIIKHGIRFSGMQAWGNKLNDDEIWKLSTFLTRLNSLPSAVEVEWEKQATDVMPGMHHDSGASQPMEHMHH